MCGGARRATIESQDLAFADLPPIAQEVMRAIFQMKKKKFTRAELAEALTITNRF
jgi:hypothetical protein